MPKVEDEAEGTRIPPKTTPRIEGIPVSIPAKTKTSTRPTARTSAADRDQPRGRSQ
jgi:hypothetical protein